MVNVFVDCRDANSMRRYRNDDLCREPPVMSFSAKKLDGADTDRWDAGSRLALPSIFTLPLAVLTVTDDAT